MTILMENEQELDLGFDYEKVLKLVIEKALEQEKCPYECEVNLTFTDNEGIRYINRNSGNWMFRQMYFRFRWLIMIHRQIMTFLRVTMHLRCTLILKVVNFCLAI